jgi:hypothetical protein
MQLLSNRSYQQMVSRTRASDVQQVPLGVVDLLQIRTFATVLSLRRGPENCGRKG